MEKTYRMAYSKNSTDRGSVEQSTDYYPYGGLFGESTGDSGRGISRIDYDRQNNPVRIQFTNGSVTRYVYSAAGEKLRMVYQTAVPNITVPIGSARELSPSEILSADSTDYLLGGSLTLRNGHIDKLQFDEGYCQATKYIRNFSQDNFTFYYYDRDHLGSIRQVVKETGSNNGTVVQTMDYYPFGAQFCQSSTDSNVQSRRYNGKEFDKMHGLNSYDYGARQYNPVTARRDRVDPLCEKYYSVSPYAYCGNNPVMLVDLDGKEWTYVKDSNGNIIINVALNFSISGNWTSEQISEYKNAISSQFNNMLSEASSGTVSGTITFYDGNSSILQSLSLGAFVDNTFGGHTEYFASSVNLYGKDGGVRAISSVASDAIHEMLHTLRLGHPFEVTQTADTELKRIDSKNFASTPSTDENIVNNIMSYPMIRVDGKSGDNQNHLTNGQLNFMLKEISLQNEGYGFFNYNKAFNNEQNTRIYKEYYESYWNNWPGTPVQNQ